MPYPLVFSWLKQSQEAAKACDGTSFSFSPSSSKTNKQKKNPFVQLKTRQKTVWDVVGCWTSWTKLKRKKNGFVYFWFSTKKSFVLCNNKLLFLFSLKSVLKVCMSIYIHGGAQSASSEMFKHRSFISPSQEFLFFFPSKNISFFLFDSAKRKKKKRHSIWEKRHSIMKKKRNPN